MVGAWSRSRVLGKTCADAHPSSRVIARASAGYGEADRDSISWCCEKSKRPRGTAESAVWEAQSHPSSPRCCRSLCHSLFWGFWKGVERLRSAGETTETIW